jgi:hypothetical protein
MTDEQLVEEIKTGAEAIIAKAEVTSEGNPRLAIGQMLIATCSLARTIDMTDAELQEAFERALADTNEAV